MARDVTRQLFLVRHGVAEERGPKWPDDTQRPLTTEGIERMRQGVRGLVRMGVELDLVLTSPLVRTRQTAEIVAASFDPRVALFVADSLKPGGTYEAVLADLAPYARRARIALVGHEPGIGQLAARLIGSAHAFEFKKGAVCRIDVDSFPPTGPGTLRWFATPKILRSIGK